MGSDLALCPLVLHIYVTKAVDWRFSPSFYVPKSEMGLFHFINELFAKLWITGW